MPSCNRPALPFKQPNAPCGFVWFLCGEGWWGAGLSGFRLRRCWFACPYLCARACFRCSAAWYQVPVCLQFRRPPEPRGANKRPANRYTPAKTQETDGGGPMAAPALLRAAACASRKPLQKKKSKRHPGEYVHVHVPLWHWPWATVGLVIVQTKRAKAGSLPAFVGSHALMQKLHMKA